MRILNTQNLKTYIKTRGVAFQPINCLFEVGDKITACAKNLISAQIVDGNWKVLTKRKLLKKDSKNWLIGLRKATPLLLLNLKNQFSTNTIFLFVFLKMILC